MLCIIRFHSKVIKLYDVLDPFNLQRAKLSNVQTSQYMYIWLYIICIQYIYIYTLVHCYQQCVTVHHVPKCMSCHKAILAITGRTQCLHDYTYILCLSWFCEENRNIYFLSYKAWKNNYGMQLFNFINISFILNFWLAILSKTKVFI